MIFKKQNFWSRTATKSLILSVSLLVSFAVYAQRKWDWRADIDYIVEQTDSLSMKSQKTFYLPRIVRVDRSFKNDKTVKETWNYTTKDGKVIIFQIRYVIDYREYTEVYYLDNDKLICMEYYEAPYLSTYIDEVRRGEMFFLVDNTVKQYVRFGNKKEPNTPFYNAEYDCITRFQERYAVLKTNLRNPEFR